MAKPKPPFLCQYSHRGRSFAVTVGGDSWSEAEQHLRSIGANGRIVGSDVDIIPVTTFNLPFVGAWVRFQVWLRNLWRGA
jgi:hypothetical protein